MRTNIEIDDKLMREAMKATGAKTKRRTVEDALRRLVEIRAGEVERQEYVRRRNGIATLEEDWLEKWLASRWKQTRGSSPGEEAHMRTNIEIDDVLLKKAMKLSPRTTKKAVVEEALILVVKLHQQALGLRKLRGVGWDGNLTAMRQSRFPDWDESNLQVRKDLDIPAA